MAFLAALEANEQQTTVRILTVRKEPAPRVEMELLNYFQKQKPASSGSANTAAKPAGAIP
jgi:hypothetical protein